MKHQLVINSLPKAYQVIKDSLTGFTFPLPSDIQFQEVDTE